MLDLIKRIKEIVNAHNDGLTTDTEFVNSVVDAVIMYVTPRK